MKFFENQFKEMVAFKNELPLVKHVSFNSIGIFFDVIVLGYIGYYTLSAFWTLFLSLTNPIVLASGWLYVGYYLLVTLFGLLCFKVKKNYQLIIFTLLLIQLVY